MPRQSAGDCDYNDSQPQSNIDCVTVSGLRTAPQKKHTRTHPFVHYGRHFGRTVYAFANVRKVIENGLKHDAMSAMSESEEPVFTFRERQEYNVYNRLLDLCDGLKEELLNESSTTEDVFFCADMIQKGASAARGNDTKGMKGAIIDWITPPGKNLSPPLNQRQKVDQGFNHQVTGKLLCPAHLDWDNKTTRNGLQSGDLVVPGHSWPMFLYEGYTFDSDNPWKGLLRSTLLVKAFKHTFISPSSVNGSDNDLPTKGGNAQIHDMKRVTTASIIYIATQVRFALSSASFWSRTDRSTDSENFYTSLLDTLEDPANLVHTNQLLEWWDRKIFPHSQPDAILVPVSGSPLDRIRQIQAEKATAGVQVTNSSST